MSSLHDSWGPLSMPSKDYSHLGPSLRRVKAGERPTDDGGKKVWHQGDKGVEVVSFVDRQGRVLRQEVHVGNEVAIWKAGKPVLTGRVPTEARTANVSRSDLIIPDLDLTPGSVFSALSLLRGFKGDDRYLAHIRSALEAVAQGLEDEPEESVVTSMQTRAKLSDDEPAEVTGRTHKVKGNNLGFWLAVGSVSLGFIAGALYLMFVKR